MFLHTKMLGITAPQSDIVSVVHKSHVKTHDPTLDYKEEEKRETEQHRKHVQLHTVKQGQHEFHCWSPWFPSS